MRHVHTVHDVQLLHPSGLLAPHAGSVSVAQKIYTMLLRTLMGSPDVVHFPSAFLRGLHERNGFHLHVQGRNDRDLVTGTSGTDQRCRNPIRDGKV